MNLLNDTTKLSEMNAIKRDIQNIKRAITHLTTIANKLVTYETKHPIFIKTNDGNINNILASLSESMDELFDQMLKTQNKILDANTITITRKLKPDSVNVNVEGKTVKLTFSVMPHDSGKITLTINGVNVVLFINFTHVVVHADDSALKPTMSGNSITFTCSNDVVTCVVESVELHRNYEFEQDEFMTFCINYFDDEDGKFFKTLLQTVHEVEN